MSSITYFYRLSAAMFFMPSCPEQPMHARGFIREKHKLSLLSFCRLKLSLKNVKLEKSCGWKFHADFFVQYVLGGDFTARPDYPSKYSKIRFNDILTQMGGVYTF